jgi:hypothetical protein
MTDTDTFRVDWPTVMREAPAVARRIARDYPGIESADIEQEIFAHAAEKMDTLARTTKNVYGLRKVLGNAGTAYASKERLTYVYYSAEWVYTPREVRSLFEVFLPP